MLLLLFLSISFLIILPLVDSLTDRDFKQPKKIKDHS